VYTLLVPRQRTLTKLELVPAVVGGIEGWLNARWQRSDGSRGAAFARFRLKSRDRWYISELLIDRPTATLLRDVPLARIETAANAEPRARAWIEKASEDLVKEARERWDRRRHRLKPPTTRRLDRAFYERVAGAYREAIAFGQPPAKTLAKDSKTPISTVNRWIAKARDLEELT
jgi:hypothetical protein